MNGAEADAAARLLERLLSDPDYRESFRAYPVAALREAGLQGVAEEMAVGGGKLLDTLDERESRSSLAGVFMAAALEGAAMFDFSKEVLPYLDELPPSVGNVLSRIHLPAIAEAQAATPAAQGVERIAQPGQSANAAAGAFPAVTPEQAAAASARAQAPEPLAQPPPALAAEPAPAAHAAAAAEPAPSSSSSASRVDPAQYGADGSGGPPSPEVQALLRNHQVTFDANGIADMKAGKMDPRIVSVLASISRDHSITVSATISDHGTTTSGGSISNHHYGRAVDIAVIDGQAVSPGNAAAHKVALALSSLPASIRPTEVGSPWDLPGSADFTDSEHQNHLHIAYDDPIASSWKQPADLAASDGAAAEGAPAAADPAVSGDSSDSGDSDDSGDSGDGSDGGEEPGGLEDPGGDTNEEADAESDGGDGGDNDSVSDDPSDEQENDESDSGDDSGADGDHDDSSDSGSDDTDDSDGSDGGEDSGDGGDSGGDSSGGNDAGGQIDLGDAAGDYPGDDAQQSEIAAWMGSEAQKRGLPAELPVMAGLVESGLHNLSGGDADSVGYFQMRVSVWNQGDYAGYQNHAELQLKWFLDQAAAVKQQRIAAGRPVNDPGSYGDWIADVERPAAQYRGRYQLRLDDARSLLQQGAKSGGGGGGNGAGALEPVVDGGGSGGAGLKATAAVAVAKRYLGTPYHWGGSTPQTGFDCSGLVQWAYAKAGIQIPRTSEQQILASNGKAVDRNHLLPGDLVFFRDSSGDVHHVGMSLGGDKFIQAPHTGDVVKVSSLKESYYAQQFTGGRRFDLSGGQGARAAAAAAGAGEQGDAPGVDPDSARAAEAALLRDAAEAQRPGTLLFEAVRVQELSNANEAQVLRAVDPSAST
jgi:cell wall-associated NlpC family hydrolase